MRHILWVWLIPATAVASPVQVAFQARVLDIDGVPVNGAATVVVELYAQQMGGEPAWDDTTGQTLSEGYVSIQLGEGDALDSAVLQANPWVGLTVNGAELPRQRIGTVPTAAASFSIDGAVRVSESGACSAGREGALKYEDGELWACDGVDYRPLARQVDGLSAITAAADCKDLHRREPGRASGIYWINPSGGPASSSFQAYCDMTTDGGGWTVVISQQAGQFSGDMKASYDAEVPQPGATAIASYWMQIDLADYAQSFRVSNTSGEVYTFDTSLFTGPVIMDNGERWVDTADVSWRGIIYGDQPVVSHYQTGQVASNGSYRAPAGHDSGAAYFNGLGIVFDWNNNDTTTNVSQHAHFGGNSNLESGWSRRGALWMIR